MAHLSRLIALGLALLPSFALACVEDQATYDANNAKPGEWYVSFVSKSGTSSFSYATSPCKGTFSEAWACGLPLRTPFGYANSALCFTAEAVSQNTSTIYSVNWETRYGCGGSWVGYSSLTVQRYSENWPAGYTHEICSDCGEGESYWFLPDVIGTSAASITTALSGSCYNGCRVGTAKPASPGINCNASGECSFAYSLPLTGEDCSDAAPPYDAETPEPAPEETAPQGEICMTSSAGVEYCQAESYGENCGYVNDKFVCLGKTDPDECWVNDDGSRLCGESAPMPPVPDNGTPGVPATPTDIVKASEGIKIDQTFNYYNSTAVAASSRDAGTTGNNPNRPSSADPRTGVGGDGTSEDGGGEASGGAACDAPPTCTGDSIQCAQLLQQWRTRCVEQPSEADVLEAIGATDAEKGLEAGPNDGSVTIPTSLDGTAFIGGASCPSAPTVSVMGQSVSLQKYWDVACDGAALLAPIVQAMGALLAALILFRSNWG